MRNQPIRDPIVDENDLALYRALKARRALDRERKACEGSLIEFVRHAWPHLGEPGEFLVNWHHQEIAADLQDLARGEVQDEIFNVPPRFTKSILVNVCFPAWVWAQPPERQRDLMGPHVKFLCLSYGATLAEDMAVKMRRLVMGEWYQRLWGKRVVIQSDQAARTNFANTAGGERISCSIEGGILGRGGDIQLIDDPHHTKGAESDTQRRETLEGMRAVSTRITDPRRSARVLIMQRLHVDDATNYAIENWRPGLRHRWFPMRYDSSRPCETDWREEDGDLLWPVVWGERQVAQIEHELGPYMASGQLQQSPVPRGGGIIQRAWWRLWPDDAEREAGYRARYRCAFCGWTAEDQLVVGPTIDCRSCGREAERRIQFPDTSFRLLSVDTGIGDKEGNSFSAATLWGVWHAKDESPRVILMEAWRGRPMLRGTREEKGLVEILSTMATRRLVDTILIEKKTRGVDLYNELDRLLRDHPWSLAFFEPTGRGDKAARLSATQPMFTNEMVWATDHAWAEQVVTEVCEAPFARNDDLSDTTSAALIWLRDNHHLSLHHEHMAEVARANVFRGKSSRLNVAELYEEF